MENNTIEELIIERDKIAAERDSQRFEITRLSNDIVFLNQELETARRQIATMGVTLAELEASGVLKPAA